MTGRAPLADLRPSTGWRSDLMQARMMGVPGWWLVRHDEREMRRRGRCDLPGLERMDVLDVVLKLPLGGVVVEAELSPQQRRTLVGLHPAVVERHADGFVRTVTPCLAVERVVVSARSFRAGLEAASSFSNYCVRSMILPLSAWVSDLELAEASFFGVGVMKAVRGGSAELLAPEPFEDVPHTAASWAFSEVLARKLNPTA